MANEALRRTGQGELPPPPPIYVPVQAPPQVVYVDRQTGQPLTPEQVHAATQPPGMTVPYGVYAPYESPFKFRMRHLAVDLLEGAVYTGASTLAGYCLHGLFRWMLDPPAPQLPAPMFGTPGARR